MIARNKLYVLVCCMVAAGYAWIALNLVSIENHYHGANICLFKSATGIPCPSCGSTRSIMAMLHGDFWSGLLINPLGLLSFVAMIAMPIWIFRDILFHKSGFYNFYFKVENLLRKKHIGLPAILFIVLNWIWNIYKDL